MCGHMVHTPATRKKSGALSRDSALNACHNVGITILNIANLNSPVDELTTLEINRKGVLQSFWWFSRDLYLQTLKWMLTNRWNESLTETQGADDAVSLGNVKLRAAEQYMKVVSANLEVHEVLHTFDENGLVKHIEECPFQKHSTFLSRKHRGQEKESWFLHVIPQLYTCTVRHNLTFIVQCLSSNS